jgi:hypothetical protein
VSRSERTLVSPSGNEGETDLKPLFGAAPTVLNQSHSDEELPTPTWDSLGEVAESDLVPSRPTYTSRPRPLGDFGFTGTFVSEETVLAGSLEVKKNKVTLWASGTQLASWKSTDCKVQRLGGNQFSIEADGETVTFTADDPDGLIDAISAYLTPPPVVSDAQDLTKSPKHTTPAKVTASPETRVTARTEPVVKPDEPVVAKKPEPLAPTSRAVRTEPQATPEPPATPEPAPRPAPTPKADQTPVIRRPRIKAFEARAAEGATTAVAAEPVLRSTSKAPAAPVSATKQDQLQEEIRRLRDVPAPTAPVEKEGPTIADRITDSAKRKFNSAKAHRWLKSDIEDVAIKTGVVASAIGIFTLFALTIFILAGGFRGEPEFVPVPTTTIPPSPTTTVVVTTLPPPPTTLFETGPAELTDRWNTLAEQSRPELVLFTDLTSPFLLSLTPYMTFEGVLDPAAGSVVLRATPTGTADGDSLILTSLGLLIGVSDPSLDGSDRRALLETLGLAIQDPQLGGLDGTVNYNGLFYHLVYRDDQGVIEFTITPEAPAATTTTVAP